MTNAEGKGEGVEAEGNPKAGVCWRVGRKLGRTLYRDEVYVGSVDTREIAEELVAAANACSVHSMASMVVPWWICRHCALVVSAERRYGNCTGRATTAAEHEWIPAHFASVACSAKAEMSEHADLAWCLRRAEMPECPGEARDAIRWLVNHLEANRILLGALQRQRAETPVRRCELCRRAFPEGAGTAHCRCDGSFTVWPPYAAVPEKPAEGSEKQ